MKGTAEKEVDKTGNQEKELRLKEVKDVIKKMKKAAGEDKIPNEAWLYSGEECDVTPLSASSQGLRPDRGGSRGSSFPYLGGRDLPHLRLEQNYIFSI